MLPTTRGLRGFHGPGGAAAGWLADCQQDDEAQNHSWDSGDVEGPAPALCTRRSASFVKFAHSAQVIHHDCVIFKPSINTS